MSDSIVKDVQKAIDQLKAEGVKAKDLYFPTNTYLNVLHEMNLIQQSNLKQLVDKRQNVIGCRK